VKINVAVPALRLFALMACTLITLPLPCMSMACSGSLKPDGSEEYRYCLLPAGDVGLYKTFAVLRT